MSTPNGTEGRLMGHLGSIEIWTPATLSTPLTHSRHIEHAPLPSPSPRFKSAWKCVCSYAALTRHGECAFTRIDALPRPLLHLPQDEFTLLHLVPVTTRH
jgi:hypothetical protein